MTCVVVTSVVLKYQLINIVSEHARVGTEKGIRWDRLLVRQRRLVNRNRSREEMSNPLKLIPNTHDSSERMGNQITHLQHSNAHRDTLRVNNSATRTVHNPTAAHIRDIVGCNPYRSRPSTLLSTAYLVHRCSLHLITRRRLSSFVLHTL